MAEPIKTSEVWAIRELRGTKETLIAGINASSAPDVIKSALIWAVESRDGVGFKLDSHGISSHDGELIEHTHITKIM